MRRRARREPSSPIEVTADALCKRWKPVVLWELAHDTRRFGQLQSRIPEIRHKVLIEVLRELEANGLVSRTVVPGGPKHVEYALTELGESLRPVLEVMHAWGRTQGAA